MRIESCFEEVMVLQPEQSKVLNYLAHSRQLFFFAVFCLKTRVFFTFWVISRSQQHVFESFWGRKIEFPVDFWKTEKSEIEPKTKQKKQSIFSFFKNNYWKLQEIVSGLSEKIRGKRTSTARSFCNHFVSSKTGVACRDLDSSPQFRKNLKIEFLGTQRRYIFLFLEMFFQRRYITTHYTRTHVSARTPHTPQILDQNTHPRFSKSKTHPRCPSNFRAFWDFCDFCNFLSFLVSENTQNTIHY